MKKIIVSILIIVLILGSYLVNANPNNLVLNYQRTLYVDDNAPPEWYNETHFKTIMEGIENSSDGDTVFVYNGTYYEKITINKSISLIGENKYYTIIDGSKILEVELIKGLAVYASYAEVNGFTIQNFNDTGISVTSHHNNVSDNVIKNISGFGIFLYGNNHMISNNSIVVDGAGISITANDSTITMNNITGHYEGISLDDSYSNTISWNNIQWCDRGIAIFESNNNIIKRNNIANNFEGVFLGLSRHNKFYENNIIDCSSIGKHVVLKGWSFFNQWRGNYWDNQIIHILPKIIIGRFGILPIPWFNIDWRPARKPYEI